MANNILSYYSIIWQEIQEWDSAFDENVARVDDGRRDTVAEAREEAAEDLQDMIDDLTSLKEKILNTPLKKLKAEYSID